MKQKYTLGCGIIKKQKKTMMALQVLTVLLLFVVITTAFVFIPQSTSSISNKRYNNNNNNNNKNSNNKNSNRNYDLIINNKKLQQQQQQQQERSNIQFPLFATTTPPPKGNGYSISADRRKELLDRPRLFWKLDKSNGNVEFGSTITLTQQLNDIGGTESWDNIAEWLTNSEALAVSIWDPNYITVLDKDLYRLQVMQLRFVTLSIQPTVDVIMKTDFYEGDVTKPIFTVESVNFDPKLQLLPGMNFDADSLGIVIEVVGRLVPGKSGKSVTGTISFTNYGKLPLPIRILPESVIKAASDTISETVSNFIIKSFQKGSKEKYTEFLQQKQQQQQQQQQQNSGSVTL
jgi:Protein of unknown function (DUF1997)